LLTPTRRRSKTNGTGVGRDELLARENVKALRHHESAGWGGLYDLV